MIPATTSSSLRRKAEAAARTRRERDEAIREAFEQGAGLREIARAVNLSHPGVKAIIERPPAHPYGGEEQP